MHWWDLKGYPDSKVHGANMGSIWGRQDPGGPLVGSTNFAIWVVFGYRYRITTSWEAMVDRGTQFRSLVLLCKLGIYIFTVITLNATLCHSYVTYGDYTSVKCSTRLLLLNYGKLTHWRWVMHRCIRELGHPFFSRSQRELLSLLLSATHRRANGKAMLAFCHNTTHAVCFYVLFMTE